ncbi:hypothetical protein OXX80_012618, partial [Metschnikowia pulcherrima]
MLEAIPAFLYVNQP